MSHIFPKHSFEILQCLRYKSFIVCLSILEHYAGKGYLAKLSESNSNGAAVKVFISIFKVKIIKSC